MVNLPRLATNIAKVLKDAFIRLEFFPDVLEQTLCGSLVVAKQDCQRRPPVQQTVERH